MPLIYDKLLEKYKFDRSIAKKSFTWFEKQIYELWVIRDEKGRILSKNQMMLESGKATTTLTPGKMYLFSYDPKHKNTLPYYDRFPLILPFSKHTANGNDYFTGLNLHYLHPQIRAKLLDRLHLFHIDTTLTTEKKLVLSWQLIKMASKNLAIKNSVKEYLLSHVKSRFMRIPGENWWAALMLPTESFQKSTKWEVWKDSQKIG